MDCETLLTAFSLSYLQACDLLNLSLENDGGRNLDERGRLIHAYMMDSIELYEHAKGALGI